MKQIVASPYTYNKTTGVIVLTGLSIGRDQLLLIVNMTRNVTYYNFADPTTTLQAFTQPDGVTTSITLSSSVISASAPHSNNDVLTIYYDDKSQELNELPYIKVNINVTDTNTDALVSNVFLRRIGEYSYESIRYKGNEDEAYLKVILETPAGGSTQRLWRLYSLGSYADVQGIVAICLPQNAGYENGDTLPPKTGWILEAGSTGSLTISYEQPSTQPITALDLGAKADAVATTDTGTFSVIALIKRGLQNWTSLLAKIPTLVSGRIPVDGSGVTQPVSGTATPSLPSGYGGDPYPAGTKIIPVGGWTDEQDGAHWQALALTDSGHLYTYTLLAPSTNLIGSVLLARGTNPANTNFTSTTPNTQIVTATTLRRVFTVFNEGAGVLYISPTGGCSTTNYQVRLSAGDYWECPEGQLSLQHHAVFATAGTARVSQVT